MSIWLDRHDIYMLNIMLINITDESYEMHCKFPQKLNLYAYTYFPVVTCMLKYARYIKKSK